MADSFTYRRLPLYFFGQVPVWAALIWFEVREGGWGWLALWGPALLFVILLGRIRVTAGERGVLAVGPFRARRFAWEKIEWIGRLDRRPDLGGGGGCSGAAGLRFASQARGPAWLCLRDSKPVRLLAIHGSPDRNQEDPVRRLVEMLADRQGTVAPVPPPLLAASQGTVVRPRLRLTRWQWVSLAVVGGAACAFLLALLGLLVHDGGRLRGSDWQALAFLLAGVTATGWLTVWLLAKGRRNR